MRARRVYIMKVLLSVSCLLGLVALLSPGCQRPDKPTLPAELTPPAETSAKPRSDKPTPPRDTNFKLKSVNMAYHNFCDANDRPPADADELAPYLVSTAFNESAWKREEGWLRQIKRGDIVVFWKQKGVGGAKAGTGIVTACEKEATVKGGFVVFADGRVEWMSPAELERVSRLIETERPEDKRRVDLPNKETMKAELDQALKTAGNEKTKEDLVRLQGLWEVSAKEQSGPLLPSRVQTGDQCSIVGDTLRFKHGTWEGASRLKLDATKEPKWIDTVMVEGGGEGVQGIYSLSGDELKLCYGVDGAPRPSTFDRKADGPRGLFVLKRVNPSRSQVTPGATTNQGSGKSP